MNDVLQGVLFSLGGNIAISVGDHFKVFGEQDKLNGKKLYHHKTKNKLNLFYSREFFYTLLGYTVLITGQIFNGYAMAFAPQTLLACIGSIQFITNLVCSRILFHRPITTHHIYGTISIIIGCLIMIFGFNPSSDQSSLTIYTLFYNFNSYHYRNYLIVVVFIFIFSIIWQYFEINYISYNNNTLPINKINNKQKNNTRKKLRNITPRGDKKTQSFSTQNDFGFCCIDPKLISGFLYSFSSAMAGTQSVVLGKTLAIIIRNYSNGNIIIFNPIDIFIIFFIIIIFLSFLITSAFWLYRRTESMVLFDTVFIAPLNQVMWLTFSTVAGGIYFHEFENANTFQWIGLILGMIFNYFGLYNLVPTLSDQQILIINMEKPQKNYKEKVDCDRNNIECIDCICDTKDKMDNDMETHPNTNKNINIKQKIKMKMKIKRNHNHKRKHIKTNINNIKGGIVINQNINIPNIYINDGIIDNDKEHETDDTYYTDTDTDTDTGQYQEYIPLIRK